jgi:Fe-Mn family superoxide dismutase
MTKRDFLKTGTLMAFGTMLSPNLIAAGNKSFNEFILPDLKYDYDSLEPYIDEETMRIHHSKHHAGYVNKLNKALEGHKLKGKNIEDLMRSITISDDDLRNNGGGHFNHSLYWKIMKPGGSELSENFSKIITNEFISFEAFKNDFKNAALSRFGSGWAWLNKDKSGKLFISSTANQDNPLMKNIVEHSGTPILGIDLWEHAYYLNYQNKRGEYIDSFFNIINWKEVERNFNEK